MKLAGVIRTIYAAFFLWSACPAFAETREAVDAFAMELKENPKSKQVETIVLTNADVRVNNLGGQQFAAATQNGGEIRFFPYVNLPPKAPGLFAEDALVILSDTEQEKTFERLSEVFKTAKNHKLRLLQQIRVRKGIPGFEANDAFQNLDADIYDAGHNLCFSGIIYHRVFTDKGENRLDAARWVFFAGVDGRGTAFSGKLDDYRLTVKPNGPIVFYSEKTVVSPGDWDKIRVNVFPASSPEETAKNAALIDNYQEISKAK